MGSYGFKVKTENEFFIVICSRCRQNLKFGDLWSTAKKCTEIRVARAARAFFLFQPIIFLLCGVAVAVAVVFAKTPQ